MPGLSHVSHKEREAEREEKYDVLLNQTCAYVKSSPGERERDK